jgi:hypothetical protein
MVACGGVATTASDDDGGGSDGRLLRRPRKVGKWCAGFAGGWRWRWGARLGPRRHEGEERGAAWSSSSPLPWRAAESGQERQGRGSEAGRPRERTRRPFVEHRGKVASMHEQGRVRCRARRAEGATRRLRPKAGRSRCSSEHVQAAIRLTETHSFTSLFLLISRENSNNFLTRNYRTARGEQIV